jgi:hypothetical protein
MPRTSSLAALTKTRPLSSATLITWGKERKWGKNQSRWY